MCVVCVCACVCVCMQHSVVQDGESTGAYPAHLVVERERNRQREEFFVEEGNRASLNKATLPQSVGGGFPFAATGTAKP